MRRRSIVGPLILIAIGGLFLVNNLRPELSIFEVIARYWPFLLIGWGLLRLIEIGVWMATNKPLPERGMSGGEWVLVVFLCLFGSGLFAFQRHVGWDAARFRIHGIEMFGEAFDFNIDEKKVAAGKAPRVLVENFRGNARIVGGDVEEIRVTGRKTIRAFQREHADEADRATPLEVVQQGDMFVIRSNQDRADSRYRVNIDLEITVPRGASIEGRGRYGDFDVTDLAGNVQIDSDNAGVRVQNIAGSVKTNLRRSDIVRAIDVKGNVDVTVDQHTDNLELEGIAGQVTVNGSYYELRLRNLAQGVRFDGTATDFRVQRCPGEIRMGPNDFVAEDVIGPVELRTERSKDVTITDATDSVTVELDRGSIELRASRLPLPKMNVQTRRGDVTLELPEQAGFEIHATTEHGEIRNDFSGLNLTSGRQAKSTLSGRLGSGSMIVVNTDRGDVSVHKASGDLLARPKVQESNPPSAPAPAPAPPARPKPVAVERT